MKNLGFGLMRLPKTDGDFDKKSIINMVDEYISRGFSYFDTAYVYDGSELIFRETVSERYPRESFVLADKLPSWHINSEADCQRIFDESLARCGVEYFDYYLLHSIQEGRKEEYDLYKCWDFCGRMKSLGKIKKFGFSFHGDPDMLEELLSDHPEVDFVQLQINYLDWESDTVFSKRNYEICRRFKKPVIVMEPVKGGLLADIPDSASHVFRNLDSRASFASFALRYVASLEGVFMVLSGMSNFAQLEDNMNIFDSFKHMSEDERGIILNAADIIRNKHAVSCTACNYCVSSCPANINIPEIFGIYNQVYSGGNVWGPRKKYKELIGASISSPASSCVECHNCENICPQHIKIGEILSKCSNLFEPKE